MNDLTALRTYFERACAQAAKACLPWIGRGNKEAADAAAVDAMRAIFATAPMSGRIVIGEGERDEAPMLFIGEEVGAGGPAIDIAVDPLEGTTLCAEDRPGALCVAAFAPRGGLLHAPDVYMQKIAAGPGLSLEAEDLDRPLGEVLARLTAEAGRPLSVVMLDRERHQELKDAALAAGATLALIPDGDVMGALQTSMPDSSGKPPFDVYVGSGGAPEGVLAAAALKCMGGQIYGRLLFRNGDEKGRATKAGITDFDRIYTRDDMVTQDVIFAATGVTGGSLLPGIKREVGFLTTETILMRSKTGSVRRMRYRNPTKRPA